MYISNEFPEPQRRRRSQAHAQAPSIWSGMRACCVLCACAGTKITKLNSTRIPHIKPARFGLRRWWIYFVERHFKEPSPTPIPTHTQMAVVCWWCGLPAGQSIHNSLQLHLNTGRNTLAGTIYDRTPVTLLTLFRAAHLANSLCEEHVFGIRLAAIVKNHFAHDMTITLAAQNSGSICSVERDFL